MESFCIEILADLSIEMYPTLQLWKLAILRTDNLFNFVNQAGLTTSSEPERILIALEPEAASIFCRKLRLRDCVWEETKRRSTVTSDEQIADEFQGKFF